MNARTLPIELAGEELLLHPDRAVIWPAQRTVFIADLHLGKDEIFRRAGIPIPPGTTQADLQRLGSMLTDHGLTRVVLLGDFLHGPLQAPTHIALFSEWRATHAGAEFIVIAGNHDRSAMRGELPQVQWEREGLRMGPFVCRHHPPMSKQEGFSLCGHVHPVVRLFGVGRERARVPILWIRSDHAVLPAFGSFTGGAEVDIGAAAGGFAFAAGEVWGLSA